MTQTLLPTEEFCQVASPPEGLLVTTLSSVWKKIFLWPLFLKIALLALLDSGLPLQGGSPLCPVFWHSVIFSSWFKSFLFVLLPSGYDSY